jgi:hypothetical protein
MLVMVGVNVEASTPDCQIKSSAVAGLNVILRLDEDPLSSTTQLVL